MPKHFLERGTTNNACMGIYVWLLPGQRVEGRRPEMRWPGNKQLIERLRDMSPTICDQEQLSIFHGSRDIAVL